MKNLVFLFALVMIVLTGCNNNIQQIEPNADESTSIDASQVIKETPFVNPILIYGSSFGEMMQMLYKTGKFSDMIKFTSKITIDKFGQDKIISFYRDMDFAYNIKLQSKTIVGDTTVLNYETGGKNFNGNILRINVVIENDSCKILMNELKNF